MERVGDRSPRLVLVLLVVSLAGIYACVPDTELVKPAVGGFAGAALLILDPELGGWSGGTSVAVGLSLWLAAANGYGRPGSVVGAVACACAPLLLARFSTGRRVPGWTALLVPVVFVLFCSRVAGFRQSSWAAAALVVPAAAVAVLAQRALCRAAADRLSDE
jgi:hypothetical protein